MSGEKQPDSPNFYDRHWERVDTSTDPHIVAKGELVARMIPDDVRTIVDVGCGDGYLTHKLAERWSVTGVDRSPVALQRLRCPAVQAGADDLPFGERSFDMLFSSQMLEHLPDAIYEGALREFSRVASRWLLISVPYRETLRRRFVCCPRCGLEFNVEGHLRSFDEATMDRAFPAFRRVRTELAGPLEPVTFAPLEMARQRLARHWFVWDGLRTECPRCSETRFTNGKRTPLHGALELGINAATRIAQHVAGRRGAPYWLLVLLERRAP